MNAEEIIREIGIKGDTTEAADLQSVCVECDTCHGMLAWNGEAVLVTGVYGQELVELIPCFTKEDSYKAVAAAGWVNDDNGLHCAKCAVMPQIKIANPVMLAIRVISMPFLWLFTRLLFNDSILLWVCRKLEASGARVQAEQIYAAVTQMKGRRT